MTVLKKYTNVMSGTSYSTKRRNYRPGKIREANQLRIISAAEQEFVVHGFKGATVNNIALRAELPKANIHYYFKSKLDLYAAVLENILSLWDDTFNELCAEDDPGIVLKEYIHAKVMFSQTNPLASRIFAKEIISGGEHLSQFFQQDYRDWFNDRAGVFCDWVALGKMDPVDPIHLIFMIWSTTQHYADFSPQICAALGKKSLTNADFQKAADTLSTIILKGCGIQLPNATSTE